GLLRVAQRSFWAAGPAVGRAALEMRKVLPVAGRHQLGHFVAGVRLLPVSGETDVLSQELRITSGRRTEDGRLEGVTRPCLSPHCVQRKNVGTDLGLSNRITAHS